VQPWNNFFPPPAPHVAVKWETFHLLRKGGQPWVLLPAAPAAARQALELYPAQTTQARWAKSAFRLALQCGWFPRTEPLTLARTQTHAWEVFLQRISGRTEFPTVAALAGNPAATGQRVVFLIFNHQGQPQWVVKAGVGESATTLIERETTILKSLPARCSGVPILRGEFSQDNVRAFAMDYCPGAAPANHSAAAPGPILSQWIDRSREIPILELPAVQQLAAACEREPWFDKWRQTIASARVHPVIMQGDFAPWNIKVHAGQWLVLDWERGELTGVPGWDWFHFVVQPQILVQRLAPEAIGKKVRNLLGSAEFQAYARTTKCQEHTAALLLAYLAHIIHIVRPSEGLEAAKQLWEYFRA